MKLHEVQSHVVALIVASESLAGFGTPIAYSLYLDDEQTRALIAERLRTMGVCIEVGPVDAERVGDRTIRGVAADAQFEVYIAESITVAHTPDKEDLRRAVIEAVTAQADHHTPRAEFLRSEMARSEQGAVLHALSFSLRITVP